MQKKGWLNLAETITDSESGVFGKMYQMIAAGQLQNDDASIGNYLRAAEFRNCLLYTSAWKSAKSGTQTHDPDTGKRLRTNRSARTAAAATARKHPQKRSRQRLPPAFARTRHPHPAPAPPRASLTPGPIPPPGRPFPAAPPQSSARDRPSASPRTGR